MLVFHGCIVATAPRFVLRDLTSYICRISHEMRMARTGYMQNGRIATRLGLPWVSDRRHALVVVASYLHWRSSTEESFLDASAAKPRGMRVSFCGQHLIFRVMGVSGYSRGRYVAFISIIYDKLE